MVKVCVIVPVYNALPYLERCLSSLAAQTLAEAEFLCIDDGSTDGSGDLLRRFARQDGRFKLFTQANAGPAAARNLGLRNARAEYVMFCDADDWYEPDCCRRMCAALDDGKADVAVCRTKVAVEDENASLRRQAAKEETYNSPFVGLFAAEADRLAAAGVVLWNKIFKKSIIDRQEIFFPAGCEHDDDAFWLLYGLYVKKILFLPEKLYNYRIRAGSIMGRYFARQPKDKNDRYKICLFVCDYARQKNLPEEKAAAVSLFCRQQAGMLFFELFSADELRRMAEELNRRRLNFVFAESKGRLCSAPRKGLKEAGRGRYVLCWLLSKICFGSRRKRFRRKKKDLCAQLKIKKLISVAD